MPAPSALDRSVLDPSREYANADFIPGGMEYPARWTAQAAAFRAGMGARHARHAYGTHAREVIDLFQPQGKAQGLMVFVHGGYWMRFEPDFWSHLAAGALARGWAVAMPGYTLTPEIRVAAITRQIARAVDAAASMVPGPLVFAGHSAGGHLSARMACSDITGPWTPRLRRVVPISPLADLRPLMATNLNDTLHLDAAEALAESPAFHDRRAGVDCTVWVGGQERPSFLWQARVLSENWDCPWHVAPGKHHFDVIDDLADPSSALVDVLLA